MFKNYILAVFAVLLISIPAPALAVEEDQGTETFEENTTGDTYYEEPAAQPWQEGNQYDNTYEEPAYDNDIQNGSYQDNSAQDNGYYDGYNDQPATYEEPYEEPYVEPYTEPYIEPYTETYEEPYTEPYVEEYIEPAETEVETEEDADVSISTVKEDGYDVSGVVSGDDKTIGNVELTLSNDSETLETTSDQNGKFTFMDVSNGTYTLSVAGSETYEAASEPVEVTVNNRNKLGYEMAVTPVEAEEDLPVEAAETDERAEETVVSGMSAFELILISTGTVLLAITVSILLFRKLSRR